MFSRREKNETIFSLQSYFKLSAVARNVPQSIKFFIHKLKFLNIFFSISDARGAVLVIPAVSMPAVPIGAAGKNFWKFDHVHFAFWSFEAFWLHPSYTQEEESNIQRSFK